MKNKNLTILFTALILMAMVASSVGAQQDHPEFLLAEGQHIHGGCVGTRYSLDAEYDPSDGVTYLTIQCGNEVTVTVTPATATPTRTAVPSTLTRTATPTRTPSRTRTPTPTRTAIPSTVTPQAGLQVWESCHNFPAAHVLADGTTTNVHEHHDCAPKWADDWSVANLGQRIRYGGDEASSSMENLMKHQSFKGIHTFI